MTPYPSPILGSLGLNLICASRVILFDHWWNPALEDQAIDRVYRIGQTRNVQVVRLLIKDSVEQRILDLQKKKVKANYLKHKQNVLNICFSSISVR